MPNLKQKHQLAKKRAQRVRGKMHGTANKPRLSLHRSNQYTYLQVIDDDKGVTVAAANDKMLGAKAKGTKTERAKASAQMLLEQLKKQKINALIFDRGSYKYHGRLRAIAEVLREGKIAV